jgi:hypothetical protein
MVTNVAEEHASIFKDEDASSIPKDPDKTYNIK